MRIGRHLLPVALALSVLLPRGAADPDADRRAALAEATRRLLELAAWDGKNGLARERDRTHALVLRLDPDRPEARAALRFSRGEDSRWTQDPRYREPKNAKPASLPEHERRLREIVGAVLPALLSFLQDPVAQGDPEVRERVVGDLLALAPDDPAVREANGEQRVGDVYLLAESARTPGRRAELASAAQAALRGVGEIPPAPILPEEAALAVPWAGAFVPRGLRVLGTIGVEETETAARRAAAAGPLHRAVFGVPPPGILDFRLHFLSGPEQAATALGNHPGFAPEERRFALTLTSVWVPRKNHVFTWAADRPTRLEWAARQPIGVHLRVGLGLSERLGWAWEGLGHYLGHLLAGTHLTYFVRATETAAPTGREREGLWARLKDPATDWRAEAGKFLATARPGDLAVLLGKDVNAMDASDVLLGHAFAAYLLEGRPEQATPFLKALGKGASPEQASRTHLGATLAALEARWTRWARETSPTAPPR